MTTVSGGGDLEVRLAMMKLAFISWDLTMSQALCLTHTIALEQS